MKNIKVGDKFKALVSYNKNTTIGNEYIVTEVDAIENEVCVSFIDDSGSDCWSYLTVDEVEFSNKLITQYETPKAEVVNLSMDDAVRRSVYDGEGAKSLRQYLKKGQRLRVTIELIEE